MAEISLVHSGHLNYLSGNPRRKSVPQEMTALLGFSIVVGVVLLPKFAEGEFVIHTFLAKSLPCAQPPLPTVLVPALIVTLVGQVAVTYMRL